jgi:hypothetical protein
MPQFVLRVRESIRIGRPIDVVRRQFGDVRHHEMRQVAEVVLERHADGSQTNHFVSGSNAGMRVIHQFQDDGPDATVAEVTIEMPMRGLRRLLAPIVRRVLRSRLMTGLEEDRRDLEQHGYPAGFSATAGS